MKKFAQILLLLFALGAVGYWAWGKFSEPSPIANPPVASGVDAAPAPAPDEDQPVVVVTYFTTNVRCESCRKIEALTRAMVDEQFAPELEAGRLRFQTINLDESENRHFANDYQISFKTVVVSMEQSGRVLQWEKRDEVWSLLNEPEAFQSYIADSIRSYLNSKS